MSQIIQIISIIINEIVSVTMALFYQKLLSPFSLFCFFFLSYILHDMLNI
jgi:hypothetical protein